MSEFSSSGAPISMLSERKYMLPLEEALLLKLGVALVKEGDECSHVADYRVEKLALLANVVPHHICLAVPPPLPTTFTADESAIDQSTAHIERIEPEVSFSAKQLDQILTKKYLLIATRPSTRSDDMAKVDDATQVDGSKQQFSHLYRVIKTLCKQLNEVLIASKGLTDASSVKVIICEDLFYTERAYIYANFERNFFKHCVALSELCSMVDVELRSSNWIRNSWGEGDTFIVALPELLDNDFWNDAADEEHGAREELSEKKIGSNDSAVGHLLEGASVWNAVNSQVEFQRMYMQGNPVPRLVSIQSIHQHSIPGRPLYRHPNDEEPPNTEMNTVVRTLVSIVESHTGVRGLNHALIQQYRDGNDNIAAHSDKTLDIDLNTPIINVSIGAERVMSIQRKEQKQWIEKIPLRHGECVVFGLKTNQYWWHEVPKNTTMKIDKNIPNPWGISRISFTLRRIATFIRDTDGLIIGQGSCYKDNGSAPEARINTASRAAASDRGEAQVETTKNRGDLIKAFSAENRQSSEFNWESVYGVGFLLR